MHFSSVMIGLKKKKPTKNLVVLITLKNIYTIIALKGFNTRPMFSLATSMLELL